MFNLSKGNDLDIRLIVKEGAADMDLDMAECLYKISRNHRLSFEKVVDKLELHTSKRLALEFYDVAFNNTNDLGETAKRLGLEPENGKVLYAMLGVIITISKVKLHLLDVVHIEENLTEDEKT